MAQVKPVVFLTGASKGIGLAVTRSLLKDFAAVVVSISRSRTSEISKLAEEYPSDFLPMEADATDEPAVRAAIRTTVEKYKRLDALVLNAGTFEIGRIGDASTTTESWRSIFDLNFFSMLYTVQEALPALRKSSQERAGGRVILVSSGRADASPASLGAYSTSKAAVNSFNRTLAAEEADIVAIAVNPSLTDTSMATRLFEDARADAEMKAAIEERLKAGQVSDVGEVGYCFASMALKAPKSLSGKFVKWDEEECKEFRKV